MNTVLTDLVNKVYIETNRPDLTAETLQAVLSSTLKMHGLDYFRKDIKTAQVQFDSTAYLQTLDTDALARFKAISYIRKWGPEANSYALNPNSLPPMYGYSNGSVFGWNQTVDYLAAIEPDDIFDDYGAEKRDVYYQAGSTLMMKSSTSLLNLLVGWYAYPDIQEETYNSWIAKEYPYAIIYDAASAILQKTGMQEVARKYDSTDTSNPGLVASHMFELIKNNVLVRGY